MKKMPLALADAPYLATLDYNNKKFGFTPLNIQVMFWETSNITSDRFFFYVYQ